MDEIDQAKLTDKKKFRPNEISKFEYCFIEEINQRKLFSKQLTKYVAAFDYIDEFLIFLNAASGGICIIWSVSVNEAPVGIAGASFTLILS